MSLIVETGACVPNADVYASRAFITGYWESRPNNALAAAWLAADTLKQDGAARDAAAALDALFGDHYRGYRRGRLQGLLWPRSEACDARGFELPDLPHELRVANAELAPRALAGPLIVDAELSGNILSTSSSVDVLSKSVTYANGGARNEKRFGIVDKILSPILKGTQPGALPTWGFR